MVRRAAKGVNERLHVVITRVSLDRVYEGRDAQRVACIGHGAGVHARSRQNEWKKKKKFRSSPATRTDGRFLSS